MPSLDPDHRTKEAPIAGDPPNPIDPPSGCRFHPRCPFAEPVCSARTPKLTTIGNDRHTAACHMVDLSSGHSRAGQSLTSVAVQKSASFLSRVRNADF
jgi:peptide/nickel transport system ATP-binding protein